MLAENVMVAVVPADVVPHSMSLRHLATAAISERAESLTVLGAWFSAKLIVPSELPLLMAVNEKE